MHEYSVLGEGMHMEVALTVVTCTCTCNEFVMIMSVELVNTRHGQATRLSDTETHVNCVIPFDVPCVIAPF